MEVQFKKNIAYRSRAGAPAIVFVSHRTACYAVIEVETEGDIPSISRQLIQRSDDGREFIDISFLDAEGQPCYSRVWASDTK